MKMKIETSDLLDRLSAAYDDEMQRPEDSFTVNEYAERNNMTRGKATFRIKKMLESGELKRKKIGNLHYYYAGE